MPRPIRGEVWLVSFDPQQGAEISKTRPAVVINDGVVGILPLKIVVPITDWKPKYINFPWMYKIDPSATNGLSKISGADAFQIKSVDEGRFQKQIGVLTPAEIDQITAAVAICIGL